MWKTVLPGTCGRWEPIELRVLKRNLANLHCACKTCNRESPPGSELYDVGVQAKNSCLFDRFIQVTPKDSLTIRHKDSTQFKQQFCPSCYVTYTLLRSGGATKILKDEEIETTKIEQLTSNKSTEHLVCSVEKTTSVTNKPVLKFSNLSLCESSESSQPHSDRAVWNASPNGPSVKGKHSKKSNREVTFLVNNYENFIQLGQESSPQDILNPLRETVTLSTSDLQYEADAYSKKNSRYRDEPYVGPKYRHCMCADELIRAIRPPF